MKVTQRKRRCTDARRVWRARHRAKPEIRRLIQMAKAVIRQTYELEEQYAQWRREFDATTEGMLNPLASHDALRGGASPCSPVGRAASFDRADVGSQGEGK